MYHTDHHQQDSYCILYYVRDDMRGFSNLNGYLLTHQIIPYCLRTSEKSMLNMDISDPIDPGFTFEELRNRNITSEELLSWSAPIALAEQYQIYLTNISQRLWSAKRPPFYNCTLPWFGPFCEFAFDSFGNKSLDEIIVFHFHEKPRVIGGSKITCYKHLNCSTSLICLDWREICDSKVDCLDGSDEFNCWQLEINECAENEYRCHNGQCIPEEFFRDGGLSPDCLDRTDEIRSELFKIACDIDPAFRCEEHTCPPEIRTFPCGDGQCVRENQEFCLNGRNILLLKDNCSIAMMCLMLPNAQWRQDWCKSFCSNETCVKDYCPLLYEFSGVSNILGHVRLMFNITNIEITPRRIPLPDYICYNENICADFLPATIHLNDLACRHLHELKLDNPSSSDLDQSFEKFVNSIKRRFHGCLIRPNEIHYCNYSTMYQCQNSTKCISVHRLIDGIRDCPYRDDERVEYSCSLNDVRFRRQCTTDNNKQCIAPFIDIISGLNCQDDEENNIENGIAAYDKHIYFQRICDGKRDLITMVIDGQNETDETACEKWPCNNTYTRCDGFWSCKDGADETNCPDSFCPGLQHGCVFPNNPSNLSCISIARAGDGTVDCLGATDERKDCRSSYLTAVVYSWQCSNNTWWCLLPDLLCNFNNDCPLGDDEKFCTYKKNLNYQACQTINLHPSLKIENFFCKYLYGGMERPAILFFKLSNMPIVSSDFTTNNAPIPLSIPTKSQIIENQQVVEPKDIDLWRCNRGLSIYVRTNNNTQKLHCLCPPSYYGDTCQYQNQRVSLTLQIQATSDWLNVSIFVITLVDHEENIESHDYIEYFPARDCKAKYNIYLLYSTRPKNSSKDYSVRIHVFNRLTLKYRSSWIFPLQYSFLPVYRIVVKLTVPFVDNQPLKQCTPPCIHGRCFNNINDPKSTFCLCEPRWSGVQCNIQHTCDCASNSLCFGASLCVCPIGRFGPRCHLLQSSCSPEFCTNRGQCVLSDQRYTPNNVNKPMCICSEQYFGDHCEYRQTRIDLSFDEEFSIPSSIIVHFITVQKDKEHVRTTLWKKLAFGQNSLSFYTEIIFHLALVETFNNYYLIILQEKGVVSENISTDINPSRRCLSIHELFDPIRANQHLLKRIKYYHLPCEQRLDLLCFYDDVHFCLCNLARQANCFEFNHNTTYDCLGHNYCENGGQCFRDDSECPKSSNCGCPDCYFGSRCQFSTKGSTISLDMILGYYINPNIQLNQQPMIIKIALALTTIIFIFGIISSFLSLLTFQMKSTQTIGCGLYLFTSSITSMLIMIVFAVKVGLFLTSQMGSINHRPFVYIQCLSMDFLVRFLLNTNEWLSACVAIERVVNVLKGIHFDRAKSRRTAKWIIQIVFLINILTHIHDPIHRYLIDDEEEQRTWCVVKYSLVLQVLDWIVNILHFAIPFGINCTSAFIIIIVAARIRSSAQKNQSYNSLLRKQCQHHKHLLISPFILVLLALPRLIISFLSGCMKSARNPWLYLAGYFLSFIPSMLTFVIFVLPSEMYSKEFKSSIKRFSQNDTPKL